MGLKHHLKSKIYRLIGKRVREKEDKFSILCSQRCLPFKAGEGQPQGGWFLTSGPCGSDQGRRLSDLKRRTQKPLLSRGQPHRPGLTSPQHAVTQPGGWRGHLQEKAGATSCFQNRPLWPPQPPPCHTRPRQLGRSQPDLPFLLNSVGFSFISQGPSSDSNAVFCQFAPFKCTNEWHQALSQRLPRQNARGIPSRAPPGSPSIPRAPGPPATTVLLSVSANLTTNTEHLSKQFFPIHRALHNHLA